MLKSLMVKNTNLVDIDENLIMLRGISNHGLSWYPQYVNYDTMKYLKDDFKINAYRLALYTDELDGFCVCSQKWQNYLYDVIDKGVKAAIMLDMYIIIDWHILMDSNPLIYLEKAKEFFEIVSKKYGQIPNVLFEICNEPNLNLS